jgi:glycosyltransferase involved in cell wall biosynthesis
MSEVVIVPRESTKKLVVEYYGKPSTKVGIIEDYLSAPEVKKTLVDLPYNLDNCEPFLLFAGEMSPYTGADLVVEALPNICREFNKCQFVFAGDGRLKGEIEKRAWDLGVGQRCRFPGDVRSDVFQILLEACHAVMIPSRIKHGTGLADLALKAGKQILATHQSNLSGVVHGENGYLVYDNPGSICWGIKEILNRSLTPKTEIQFHAMYNQDEIAQLYLEQWVNIVSRNTALYEEKVFSGTEYNIFSL